MARQARPPSALLLAALLATLAALPLAVAEPPEEGPLCDRNPILDGVVSVGQCGDFVRCFVEHEGQFGVYLALFGFGVLPERALVYCFGLP